MKNFELLLALILISCLTLPLNAAFNTDTTTDDGEVRLKVAAESVMTRRTNVSAINDVDKIWRYVDYLWEQDRKVESQKYIEAGLTLAPFNYQYQARLAIILAEQGFNSAAHDRARIVYEKSEDPATVEMVLQLIGEQEVAPFPPLAQLELASPTVILVSLGEVDRRLIQELRQKMSDYLSLKTVVLAATETLPPPDRNFFISEIRRMRGTILSLPEMVAWLSENSIDPATLKADDELFVATMEKFLAQSNQAAASSFKKNMERAKLLRQQWSYDSLRDHLVKITSEYKDKNWLMVGITECDMYMADTNYVFAGTNPYRQAIISYHRFKADFNDEPQNRRRLLSRLFKQFLSVFGLLNGMRRCTFPDCARVFPRNLAEHDEKPEYLCNECRKTLEKILSIKIHPIPVGRR